MSAETVDILLYGLGAIGSFYAFVLSRSKEARLTVVARSNYEVVRTQGLTIDSENHGRHVVHPFKVVRTPAEAPGPYDYIVCAHKAIDQDAATEDLAPAIRDETTTAIVIIQNGVGNEEPFRTRFPGCVILSCVTWVGATQTSPGIIVHSKSEDMQLGLFPNPELPQTLQTLVLNNFASLLSRGRTTFQVLDNIQTQRWEKVVWNAAWNSLTTLTMLDTRSWLASSPDAMPLTRRVMREVIDVGRACGVPGLEDQLVDTLMEKILSMPGIGSSMQADFRLGRPLEVDAILGYPVRRARELGLEVPALETIYIVLKGVDCRLRSCK